MIISSLNPRIANESQLILRRTISRTAGAKYCYPFYLTWLTLKQREMDLLKSEAQIKGGGGKSLTHGGQKRGAGDEFPNGTEYKTIGKRNGTLVVDLPDDD
jgi:hypothetical protein